MPSVCRAAPSQITYAYDHHLFTLHPSKYIDWRAEEEHWTYRGSDIVPLARWRTDGDSVPPLPDGVERTFQAAWNRAAIARVLHEQIATKFDRAAGAVTIDRTSSGSIVFRGAGMTGRRVDIERAVTLTIDALDRDIDTVLLPVEEFQPQVTILDEELLQKGIREVVAVGESDFSDSPPNRIHNIHTGLSRFNGHIIPKGDTFSFVETLGPVNAATGYRPELVILGDKTIPEYGGGLCQVSSTAYRGVWEYGFPILQRKNHSFAVNHYSPQGTDATIYPPNVDIKFLNDGPGDLLIQTLTDEERELAYFVFYGTRDDRQSQIIGPFTWGHVGIPPPRTEYTNDLPPGTKRKVGSPVPGMKAAWFRVVRPVGSEAEIVEAYYSSYEARPLYYQVGMDPSSVAVPSEPQEPSWMLSPDETVVPPYESSRDRTKEESDSAQEAKPSRRSIIRSAQ